MSKIILVTGGARSGKSSFAEAICEGFDSDVLYIATAIPFDDEMKLRIQKHRARRPRVFETIECYRGFSGIKQEIFKKNKVIMLDCVTIMVTNILLDFMKEKDELLSNESDMIQNIVLNEITDMLDVFRNNANTSVIVTNELGMGIVPENYLSRLFRDIAGLANQLIAKCADEVYFCVSGIPMKIK